MAIELYIPGQNADIYAYINPRGEALAVDFLEGLILSDRKKTLRLLEEFARSGEIRNKEKFRFEEKPIYAFKSFQVRILCFYLPRSLKRTIVLTHGYIKKRQDLPPAELEKAQRIYKEIVNNLT